MWNPLGLVVSLMVIAAGAILIWAVTAEVAGLDLTAIGWVLLIVGLIAFLITLVLWSPWTTRYARSRTYVDEAPRTRVVERPRREIVETDTEIVEDEGVPPPGPLPPPP